MMEPTSLFIWEQCPSCEEWHAQPRRLQGLWCPACKVAGRWRVPLPPDREIKEAQS